MSKHIKLIILVIACGILLYICGSQGWLVPDAVRVVRSDSVEDIEKRAEKKAAEFDEKMEEGKLASGHSVASEYRKLGNEYVKRQEWTPAINSFKKAVEYGLNNAAIHHSLGVSYANRGRQLASSDDFNQAAEHYRLAIEISPSLWEARYGLAILKYYEFDQRDEAVEMVRNIIRGEPEYYPARFALGRFLYEDGKPSEALSVYEETYSMLKQAPDIYENRQFIKQAEQNIQRLMTELSRQ